LNYIIIKNEFAGEWVGMMGVFTESIDCVGRDLSMKGDEGRPDLGTVFVVDDDEGLRGGIESILVSVGHRVESFGSIAEFLPVIGSNPPGCLVLDVRMPGGGGLDLQRRMIREGLRMPIVFISGHGDIEMSIATIKAGAVDFLPKPFRQQALLDAVQTALERDRDTRRRELRARQAEGLLGLLTAREREVFDQLTKGFANKHIAHKLGISEITVKLHRKSLLSKLHMRSVHELIEVSQAEDEE
jgi:FixJ family two-component response regulator